MTKHSNDEWAFSPDRPISGRDHDRFKRVAFADALVAQLVALPKEESFVFGLTGAWGSGKTSILRMVEESVRENREVLVLKFNPWLFSGTEHLVAHFFQEVAAQLAESKDKKLQDIGEKLVTYSEALSPLGAVPILGEWIERAAGAGKFLGNLFKRRGGSLPNSVTSQRTHIETALATCGKRLWVVVDDIDRLSKSDIRELFKLVRLTADFPGVTYILAFDRGRVEEALSETEGEGRAYLAKILQVSFDVPVIRPADLRDFLLVELGRVVGDRPHGPFESVEWSNMFLLCISPLFRTPRDVRRYTNAIPMALSVVGSEVALAELLAIEAVRCMAPDVWSMIQQHQRLLTGVNEVRGSRHGVDSDKANFESILTSAGEHRAAVQELLARLFPPSRRFIDNHHFGPEWAKRWRKERRLAAEDVLQFYFEKSLPGGVLYATEVQSLFDNLGNLDALRVALNSMTSSELEHVCGRLEVFEDDFPPEKIEVALLAFLERYRFLREGRHGFSDFGADLAMTRLALRLLRRVPDEEHRGSIVARVAHGLDLSARKQLVDLVGWREGVGHKLVSRRESADLEESLAFDILAADVTTLEQERDLVRLLNWADDGDGDVSGRARELVASDAFFVRLLRSSLSHASSRPMGDVVGTTMATLWWPYLRLLLGDDVLVRRVREVGGRASELSLDARDQLAVDSALKYAGGWRPKNALRDAIAADEPMAVLVEQQRYGAEMLLDLLQSVVSARRRKAVTRLTERVGQGASFDEGVRAQVLDMVRSGEVDATERIALVDMLGMSADHVALRALAEWWTAGEEVDSGLSQKIGATYAADVNRLQHLLEVLQGGATDGPGVQRVAGVLGELLAQSPAWLTHDDAERVRAIWEPLARGSPAPPTASAETVDDSGTSPRPS